MKAEEYLKVYLVTDRGLSRGRSLEEVVEEAVAGGTTIVQLREKECSSREFYEQAVRLKKLLQGTGIPFVINDRLDIALAVDADGIHIGQSDLPYAVARRILGPDKIIGLTLENFEDLLAANETDVDYVAFQAYDTTTKLDAPPAHGLDGLRKAVSLSRHPLVAIGGIHLSNAEPVVQTGVQGLAVVSEIMSADSPRKASEDLLRVFEKGRA